jgi:hypothetical protein
MFGVNVSIWGFFKVSKLFFFGDGPIKEAHCKTTPSPLKKKTKRLKRHPN